MRIASGHSGAAGRRALALGMVMVLGGLAARAETSAERAKRVLDNCLAAIGGPAFLAMRDRVEQGRAYSFYRDKLTGLSIASISTQYLPPSPGKLTVREREDFGKKKDAGSVLFTETEAYQITFRGAQPLPKERFERYRETVMHDIFYILHQRMAEKGMYLDFRSADVLDNRPVEIVDITDAENETTTVYIDQTTHLPLRQRFYRRNPVTRDRDEEITVFTKYRDAGGGVQWPFSIERDRNGEKISQIFSESVTINQNLPDSLFALPSGIRMIKPR
ncbi:MAG TPA: hypothetical protein VHD76_05210 [Bryobacteraceae bacterium]|jgi:hypothetical protein|nr:hypothetical protein [Bryobacteraceae bacterium]